MLGAFVEGLHKNIYALTCLNILLACFFLQETHLSEVNSLDFVRSLGRDWEGISVSSNGASGGLLLVWRIALVKVHVVSKSACIINSIVQYLNNAPWLLSGIYANTNPIIRNKFWNDIGALDLNDILWLMISDFNCITNECDKFGGSSFIDQTARDSLIVNFSSDEIASAVKFLGSGKSPGPDGFTEEFFKTYWDIISVNLHDAFKYFYDYETLPVGWNDTCLVFISKNNNPKTIKDYRLIVLRNVTYRILAKVLAVIAITADYADNSISEGNKYDINSGNNWSPPPKGIFKWNVDASISTHADFGSYSVICKNFKGEIVYAVARINHNNSVLVNEGLAVNLVMKNAAKLNMKHNIIESDSKLFIDMCNNYSRIDWCVKNIIDDIKFIAGKFDNVTFKFAIREANKAVDWLAIQARRLERNLIWEEDWPLI
ncbi:Retrovirus-related Pol polyprotein LINE-1 [Canna indica]|uniref:Retrovirus-related Pol polyprotein LINE-1 n=1 Tax=Canna indica TaxID=4628 RepID=A0AAQ3KRU8_9LILI|nr:Retrovirus-related Pol polyprotein LINE-1 [Canna indica]